MKILIGCPTCDLYDYVLDDYINAIKQIKVPEDIEIDLLLIDNSEGKEYFEKIISKGINALKGPTYKDTKKTIVESRNILRKHFLEKKYYYLLSLEQDVIIGNDDLMQLLSHGKNIISALYTKKTKITIRNKDTGEIKAFHTNLPIAYLYQGKNDKGKEMIRPANPGEIKGLMKMGATGLGCILIAREVLEKIRFRYELEKKAYDDIYFCRDARHNRYEIFIDGNIRALHNHQINK